MLDLRYIIVDLFGMKRPNKAIICSTPWTISYHRDLGSPEAGITYLLEHKIKICSRMPEQAIKATLLHELLHALSWTFGFHPDPEELEESVVSLFSAPLLQLLQENDKIRTYLFEG